MSAPSSWRAQFVRWLGRGAAAVAGGAVDALFGAVGSRSVTVAALALVLAGGVAWAAARATREDRVAARVLAGMDRTKPDTQQAVRVILAAAAAERQAKADNSNNSGGFRPQTSMASPRR